MNNDHAHENEVLYMHCHSCGSGALNVAIVEGALLFDCAVCEEQVGMIENIEEDTKTLLEKGCDHNN